MDIIRMNGAGNSFFVLEDPEGELRRRGPGALARQLCRPEEGEQTDGMIVIIPAEGDEDFGMLFYNADGSLGEMCGNGARCAARYGVEHGLVRDDQQIRFLATAGEIRGRRITEDLYEVRLNDPSVVDRHRLAVTPDGTVPCCYVELGSPGIPPKGANVSFVCPTGEGCVRAITFERGVEDFTLACGTGAGAIAVSMDESLQVAMPGGTLSIRLVKDGGTVKELYLTGPTEVECSKTGDLTEA